MAIETPIDVLRRLREDAKRQRLAEISQSSQAIQRARPGKDRTFTIGKELGGAFAQGIQRADEPGLEETDEYKQAVQRRVWLRVAPDDTATMKKNILAATDAGDYEAANYLGAMYQRARELEIQEGRLKAQQTAAETKDQPKPKKWKGWDKDFRDRSVSQLSELPWVTDINDEEEEAKVTDALIARAESQWNQLREAGHDVPRERVLRIVAKDAQQYFKKGILNDTFDFSGFHETPNTLEQFLIKPEQQAQQGTSESSSVQRPPARPPAIGEERGGYYYTGGDPSNPASWSKTPPKENKSRKSRSNVNR